MNNLFKKQSFINDLKVYVLKSNQTRLELAKKAGLSTTVIQKVIVENSCDITLKSFLNLAFLMNKDPKIYFI